MWARGCRRGPASPLVTCRHREDEVEKHGPLRVCEDAVGHNGIDGSCQGEASAEGTAAADAAAAASRRQPPPPLPPG